MHKDVVIDGNVTKDVQNVKYLITTCAKLNQNNYFNAFDTFDINNEGGSFAPKDSMRLCLPKMLNLLKFCVSIDPKITHKN